jgi:transposase-like protein
MKEEEKQRILAVRRFFAGEKPESICSSLGRSRPWLYKWVRRHSDHDDAWFKSASKKPVNTVNRTPTEIEEIVKLVRLNLYNAGTQQLGT